MLDYIVDFYCHELKLAIEINRDSHGHELAIKNDKVRQSRIEKYGVKFIRFDDLDIEKNISRVLEEIFYWVEGNSVNS